MAPEATLAGRTGDHNPRPDIWFFVLALVIAAIAGLPFIPFIAD